MRNERIATAMERVYANGSEMPQLKIVCGEDEYYLSPFRGYAFQVSNTINGVGSVGCSEVVGLGNIVKACDGYVGTASNSSIYAANVSLTKGYFSALCDVAIAKSGIEIPLFFDGIDGELIATGEIINDFVEECISYVRKLVG